MTHDAEVGTICQNCRHLFSYQPAPTVYELLAERKELLNRIHGLEGFVEDYLDMDPGRVDFEKEAKRLLGR